MTTREAILLPKDEVIRRRVLAAVLNASGSTEGAEVIKLHEEVRMGTVDGSFRRDRHVLVSEPRFHDEI